MGRANLQAEKIMVLLDDDTSCVYPAQPLAALYSLKDKRVTLNPDNNFQQQAFYKALSQDRTLKFYQERNVPDLLDPDLMVLNYWVPLRDDG